MIAPVGFSITKNSVAAPEMMSTARAAITAPGTKDSRSAIPALHGLPASNERDVLPDERLVFPTKRSR